MSLHRPFLPQCFLHWTDTSATSGQDVMRIVSWRRTLTLRGTSFADFERDVLPLLNGQMTTEDICDKVSDTFAKADVVAALDMLAAQGIVVEADEYSDRSGFRDTHMGWLGETAPDGRAAQEYIANAHVVIFGAGQHGAVVARSLVASGIGRMTIVDHADVAVTDLYFSGLYRASDIGRPRAEVLRDVLAMPDSGTVLESKCVRLATDDNLAELVSGATLALCCLDGGELRLALRLNRVCLRLGLPWVASSLEGSEVVVGPGFYDPQNSACYQCWRTREIAAAAKPETRYALERHLEELDTDLSPRRENVAAAVDIAGGLLAAEVLGWLSKSAYPALDGRFLTVSIPGLRIEKHMVLRKPDCSACAGLAQ